MLRGTNLAATFRSTKFFQGFNAKKTIYNPENLLIQESKNLNITTNGMRQAEFPVGRQGWELRNTFYQPRKNQNIFINEREYSGHALDQMQNRGLVPSVIENTIKKDNLALGKKAGTVAYYDPINNVSVIINSQNGRVITTSIGNIKQ